MPLQVNTVKNICLLTLLKSEKAYLKKIPSIVCVSIGSQIFSAADVFNFLFKNKFQTCKKTQLKQFKHKAKITDISFRELVSDPWVHPPVPGEMRAFFLTNSFCARLTPNTSLPEIWCSRAGGTSSAVGPFQGALAGRFGSEPSWGWQGEDKLLGKQSLVKGICHRTSQKAIYILRYCHPEVAYVSALAFSEDALMHQSPHLLPLKSKVNVSTALNREDSPTEGVYGMRSLGKVASRDQRIKVHVLKFEESMVSMFLTGEARPQVHLPDVTVGLWQWVKKTWPLPPPFSSLSKKTRTNSCLMAFPGRSEPGVCTEF